MKSKICVAMVATTLLVCLLFVACDYPTSSFSGLRKSSVEQNTATSIDVSCEYCKGTATYKIKIKEEYSQSVKYDIKVKEGTVSIKVEDNDGKEIANQTLNPAEDNYTGTFELGDYGKYKITMVFEEFSGSYKFDWSK